MLIKTSDYPADLPYPAPLLGEHNAEILHERLGTPAKSPRWWPPGYWFRALIRRAVASPWWVNEGGLSAGALRRGVA